MENLNLITINKNMKLDSFDCGNKYINDFLKNKALHNFYINESSTKVLLFEEEIIGFYTTKIDNLKYNSEDYYVVYLESIAVDKQYQGMRLGQLLLDNFISKARDTVEFLGLLGISLKAVPTKRDWYEKNGFEYIEEVEEKLNLMIYDFRTEDYFEYYDSLSYWEVIIYDYIDRRSKK